MPPAPGSIRRRRDFASLAASRDRGRSGPIRITRARLAGDPGTDVAYALGRAVGTAVRRNRVRRRLRVLMRACLDDGTLSPGRYLVSAGPAVTDLTFAELEGHVRAALADLA